MKLNNEEINRYSRHLTLPEVGMAGQLEIKESRVLMIGAGGLGSPLGSIWERLVSAKLDWLIST